MPPEQPGARPDKTVTYLVNAEPQTTDQHKLTGREILVGAGFTPVEDYDLTRNAGNQPVGLDEDVTIHPHEAFTATFKGPTPTS